MSKHTPGPWTQGTSINGRECVWLNGQTEPDHEMGPYNNWIDCVTEANARLIAAAPELLDAAKAVAFSNGFDAALPDKMEALRAAISKATGEQ